MLFCIFRQFLMVKKRISECQLELRYEYADIIVAGCSIVLSSGLIESWLGEITRDYKKILEITRNY